MPSSNRAGVRAGAACILAVAACGQALAQQAPAQPVPAQIDPGAITRQTIERQGQAASGLQAPGSQTEGLVAPDLAEPLVFPEGGPTFLLRGVTFTPSALLTPEELDAIAAPRVGTQVDLAGLQSIANEVNELYAARGFVTASAILPPQDLASGVLQVQLVEGRVGAVGFEGRRTLREDHLARAVPLEAGSVVDAPVLTREVDRFNRTSTAQIQASLQPGTEFGLTDINLAVVEPRRNTLQVFGDNLGVESVGEYQVGVLYQHYGLLGFDDRFTGYGLLAEGNLFGNAAYNLAISPRGTRAGLSYSRSAIRIVGGPFADLDVDGASQVVAANLSHPLYSGGPYLLLGNMAGSYAQSSTDQTGVRITDDETVKGTFGLQASYLGQVFSVTLAPTFSVAQADINITGRRLDYQIFQMSGTASLRLDERTLVTARGTMQIASDNVLPGSDLFQIGGPATVRGFPSSAATGDSGYVVNLEAHRSMAELLPGLESFVFLDTGTVYADFPSRQSLTSVGAGFSYNWNDRLRAEVTFGLPLGRDVVQNQSDGAIYARIVGTVF